MTARRGTPRQPDDDPDADPDAGRRGGRPRRRRRRRRHQRPRRADAARRGARPPAGPPVRPPRRRARRPRRPGRGPRRGPAAHRTEAFLRSAHIDHGDPPLPPADDADVGARYARDAMRATARARTRRDKETLEVLPSATRSAARPQRQAGKTSARRPIDQDTQRRGCQRVRQAAGLAVPLLVLGRPMAALADRVKRALGVAASRCLPGPGDPSAGAARLRLPLPAAAAAGLAAGSSPQAHCRVGRRRLGRGPDTHGSSGQRSP